MLKPIRTQAEKIPHTIAAHGSTTEQPDVMATNPLRTPLQTSSASQWPTISLLLKRVTIPAAEPASVVVTAVRPTAVQFPWSVVVG